MSADSWRLRCSRLTLGTQVTCFVGYKSTNTDAEALCWRRHYSFFLLSSYVSKTPQGRKESEGRATEKGEGHALGGGLLPSPLVANHSAVPPHPPTHTHTPLSANHTSIPALVPLPRRASARARGEVSRSGDGWGGASGGDTSAGAKEATAAAATGGEGEGSGEGGSGAVCGEGEPGSAMLLFAFLSFLGLLLARCLPETLGASA